MKSKISKILGIGLAVSLLLSLLTVAPASAGALTWSTESDAIMSVLAVGFAGREGTAGFFGFALLVFSTLAVLILELAGRRAIRYIEPVARRSTRKILQLPFSRPPPVNDRIQPSTGGGRLCLTKI